MGGMGGKHPLDTGSGPVTEHVQGEVNMLIFYTAVSMYRMLGPQGCTEVTHESHRTVW